MHAATNKICRHGQGHVGELGVGRMLCMCGGGGFGGWGGIRQCAVCVWGGGVRVGIGVGLGRVLCVGGGLGLGLGWG